MRISKVDPAYRNATQLIAALKRGEYSAVELLEQTIQRIEPLDGRINAIVVRYFEISAQRGAASSCVLLMPDAHQEVRGPALTTLLNPRSFDLAGNLRQQ